MPAFFLDSERRVSNTSDSAYKVSPTNKGCGKTMSVQPKFAMAFWLISLTLIPTITETVKVLFTRFLPNSVALPYSLSKCKGCVFIVKRVNQVLSDSVMVLPGRCS